MGLNIRDNNLKFQYFSLFVSLIFVIYISAVFFLGQLVQSAQKPFWGDEIFGLQGSIRSHSYLDLILNGAQGQGSPSPLDYIFVKCLDQLRHFFDYAGIKDEVFLRLAANGVTLLSGLIVVGLMAREVWVRTNNKIVQSIQLILLPGVLVSFLFSSMIYYYAAETRPYALWTSMWFLSLGVIHTVVSRDDNSLRILLILCVLGLTATTSFFQISSIALAYYIVCAVQKENVVRIFLKMVKIFSIPLVLNLYYTLKVGQWYTEKPGTWDVFFDFWNHKSTIVPLMLVSAGLCFLKSKSKKMAVVPLAVLFLYLLGPAIFKLTILKGFFYTERQYIYYDVIYAVFLMTTILCLPVLLEGIKNRFLFFGVIICVIAINGAVVFKKKITSKFNLSKTNANKLISDPSIILK